MINEVKELIDNLNDFSCATFWIETDSKKKKRFDREIAKIKKMLIKEGLL